MPGVNILSFQRALGMSGSPHLLLGNGFSIACKRDIFLYRALLAEAGLEAKCPAARKVFDVFGTTDFEAIIQKLEDTAKIIPLYDKKLTKAPKRISDDAHCIREALIRTLTDKHPESPDAITVEQYRACRRFLFKFKNIYTLNYDLLLYWALMQREVDNLAIPCNDGFVQAEDGGEDYVIWEPNQNKQNIFYLHGALHLFDAKTEVHKYTWVNTGVKLITQIRKAMDARLFPIFVSEGESSDKLNKIMHNSYLSRARRSFANITGDLFIFGHSLAPNDEHILKLIEKGKLSSIFVGLYDAPDSKAGKAIVNRANRMATARTGRRSSLAVHYFDARSANVWGT